MYNPRASAYRQISASSNVCPFPASITSVFCSSSTSGTCTVFDDRGTGTAIRMVDTFPLVAGQTYLLDFIGAAGINVVIGGAASITVGYQQ